MRRTRLLLVSSLLLVASSALAQPEVPVENPPPPAPAVAPPPAPKPPPPSPQLAPPPAALELPNWLRFISLGGGALLWYYQPFLPDTKNNASLYFANLVFDARYKRWGVHLEGRFRDTKLRPFFDGPVWAQEAYAFVTLGTTTIKAGKIYSHLGYFWDGSFYGNVQVYDGLKLDPDYGLSAEGAIAEARRIGLRWWAQFFLVDGNTNVSLPGRDTISIAGAHRRNQLIGRVEPFFKLARNTELRLGASGEFLQADLPTLPMQNVARWAADFKLAVGPWDVWGEFLQQDGQTVVDFPIPPPTTLTGTAGPVGSGKASAHNDYYWIGTELTLWKLTARYAFSAGNYRDVGVYETFHLPSLGVQVNSYLSLLAELVYWQRFAPTGTTFVDRSLNVTLYAHF